MVVYDRCMLLPPTAPALLLLPVKPVSPAVVAACRHVVVSEWQGRVVMCWGRGPIITGRQTHQRHAIATVMPLNKTGLTWPGQASLCVR